MKTLCALCLALTASMIAADDNFGTTEMHGRAVPTFFARGDLLSDGASAEEVLKYLNVRATKAGAGAAAAGGSEAGARAAGAGAAGAGAAAAGAPARPEQVMGFFGGAEVAVAPLKLINMGVGAAMDALKETQMQSVVVDGGTNAGIMQVVGEKAVSAPELVTPLGVFPRDAHVVKKSNEENFAPHHKGYVMAGNSWGDETSSMFMLFKHMAALVPAIGMVGNGGGITQKEIRFALASNIPLILLGGTGRATDSIADMLMESTGLNSVVECSTDVEDVLPSAVENAIRAYKEDYSSATWDCAQNTPQTPTGYFFDPSLGSQALTHAWVKEHASLIHVFRNNVVRGPGVLNTRCLKMTVVRLLHDVLKTCTKIPLAPAEAVKQPTQISTFTKVDTTYDASQTRVADDNRSPLSYDPRPTTESRGGSDTAAKLKGNGITGRPGTRLPALSGATFPKSDAALLGASSTVGKSEESETAPTGRPVSTYGIRGVQTLKVKAAGD